MKVLVMLSGGMDSTAVLKMALEDAHDVHVHHVHLMNNRERYLAEEEAVEKILAHFCLLPYSESTFDFRKLGVLMDLPVLGFAAAAVCRVHTDIEQVWTGARNESGVFDGWSKISNGPPVRIATFKKVFDAACDGHPNTPAVRYPIASWEKQKVKDYLGAELYSMTWSCRMPIWHCGVARPCGTCMACREVASCS